MDLSLLRSLGSRLMNSPFQVPSSFDLPPAEMGWLHWSTLNPGFFRGRGRPRSGPYRMLGDNGGVYLVAWSCDKPVELAPTAASVKYVGETTLLRRNQ